MEFVGKLEKDQESQATWIKIPQDIQQGLGWRRRVAVRGTLNESPFRSSAFPYGGVHYLGVNRKLRAAAGIEAGDLVRVSIEEDTEPREVVTPLDLQEALKTSPAARTVWENLSYSHRREYANAIEEAKKPETRTRRIRRTLEALSKMAKPPA